MVKGWGLDCAGVDLLLLSRQHVGDGTREPQVPLQLGLDEHPPVPQAVARRQPADPPQPAAQAAAVHGRGPACGGPHLPVPPGSAGLLQPLLRGHVRRRHEGEPGRRGQLPRLAAPRGAGAAAGLRLHVARPHQRGECRVAAGGQRHAAVPRDPRRLGRVPGEEPAPDELPGHDAAVRRPPVRAAVPALLADLPGPLRRPVPDRRLPGAAGGQAAGAGPQRGPGGGGREPGVRGGAGLGEARPAAPAAAPARPAALRAAGPAARALPAAQRAGRRAGGRRPAGAAGGGGGHLLQAAHPAERRAGHPAVRPAPQGQPRHPAAGRPDLRLRQDLRHRPAHQGGHPQGGHPQPPQGVQRLCPRLPGVRDRRPELGQRRVPRRVGVRHPARPVGQGGAHAAGPLRPRHGRAGAPAVRGGRPHGGQRQPARLALRLGQAGGAVRPAGQPLEPGGAAAGGGEQRGGGGGPAAALRLRRLRRPPGQAAAGAVLLAGRGPLDRAGPLPAALALHLGRAGGRPHRGHRRRHRDLGQLRLPLQHRHLPVVPVRRRGRPQGQLPLGRLRQPPLRGRRLLWRPALQDPGLLRCRHRLLEQCHHRALRPHSHRLRQHLEVSLRVGSPPRHHRPQASRSVRCC